MVFERLAAELVLDSSGFSQGVRQADDDLDQLESSTQSARESIAKMGAVAAGVGAVGLAASAKAAADYETAMTEVAKVTSEATADELNKSLLEMSKTIPLTATELSNLAEQAGRFGIKGTKNIEQFTRVTAKMAEATDLSAQQAGEAFARLATLTDTPIDQVENLGSAINTLSNNMATSSQEIVDSMLRASGAMTQLGVSNTEIVALSGSLNAVSESSERAGSRLRRLAQETQAAGAKKIPTMSKALGVTKEEFKALRQNDPTQLIRMMAASMAEGGEQARTLGKAFSTTSRQALAGLGQNLKGLDSALKQSNTSFKEATSLQKEFNAVMDTTAAQAKLLRNEIVAVAVETGQRLLPYVKSAITALRGLVGVFAELNSATNGLAGVFAGLALVVGGVVTAVAALSPQIVAAAGAVSSSMIPALQSMAAGLSALLGPIALVGAAVAGLAAAWISDFAGIRTATLAVIGVLKDELTATARTLQSVFGPILADLAAAFEPLRTAARSTATAIEAAVARIITAAKNTLVAGIRSAGEAVRGGLQQVASYWDAHGTAITTTIRTTLQQIIGQVKAGVAVVEQLWRKHGQTIKTAVSDYYLALRAQVSQAVAQIQSVVATAVGRATQLWNKHGAAVMRVAGQIGGGIQRAATQVQNALEPILTKVQELGIKLGFLDKQARPTIKTLAKVGIAIAGLTNPITTAIGAFLVLRKAWDTNVLGIRTSAQQIFPQIRTIIQTAFDQIRTTVQTALNNIQTYWNTTLRPLIQQTVEIFTQLGTAVWNGMQWIWQNAIVPILNSILQQWRIHGEELIGEVVETYEAIKQAIITVVNFLQPYISAFLDIVIQYFSAFVTQALAFWNQWGDEILAVTRFVFDLVGSIINTALDFIFTAIEVTLNLIQGDWEEAWNTIAEFTERLFNGIQTFVSKWGGAFLSWLGTWLGNVIGDFTEWANNIFHNGGSIIKSLFNDAASWIQTTGKSLFDAAVTAVTDAVEAVFEAFYEWLIGGSFIQETFGEVANWIATTGKSLVETAVEALTSAVETLFENMKEAIVGIAQDAVRLVESAFNGIDISGAKSAMDSVISAAKSAWSWLGKVGDRRSNTDTSTEPDNERNGNREGGDQRLRNESNDNGGSSSGRSQGGGNRGGSGGSVAGAPSEGASPGGPLQPMASGGDILTDGLIYAHAGEHVLPKARVDKSAEMDAGGGGDTYEFYIEQREGEDGEALARRVADILQTKDKRSLDRKASRNA